MNEYDHISGYIKEPQKEYFIKFLMRFFKEPWFDKPNYLLVFMHLLRNVNWHKSTVIYKNEDYQLDIGQCIVSQTKLANQLGLSKSTIHNILTYFKNLGEIEMISNNSFTIITIKYLTNGNVSEQSLNEHRTHSRTLTDYVSTYKLNGYEVEKNNSEHQANTPRTPTDASIDNIDNKDKLDKKSNKINFVEVENLNLNKEKTKMKTKAKKDLIDSNSVQKQEQPQSIIDRLLSVWSEEYFIARGIDYIITLGKDRKGISRILEELKKEQPLLKTDEMIEYFRSWVKKVFAIEDTFIKENCNPMFIVTYLNKVNIKLKSKLPVKIIASSVGFEPDKPDYNMKFK